MRNPTCFVHLLSSLLIFHPLYTLALYTQAEIAITPPPVPTPTECASKNLLQRQDSCSYGACGTECLSQGAFCCGPAGTSATSPYWVCDNGACITSVRGSTGIVDCYDPDNPQGTTQSCIDHVPTATCNPTDRCYTCSTDEPFCFWETYIAAASPTLRWFSCVPTKMIDATFYAATITGNLTYPNTISIPSSAPTTTNASSSPVLSTGAIVGISVGGGIALIGCVAIVAYCCVQIRKNRRKAPLPHPMIYYAPPAPPAEMASDAPPKVLYPQPSTTYSPTQSSTRFSPSQTQSAYHASIPRDDIEQWRMGTSRGAGEGMAELPVKRASPTRLERDDMVTDEQRGSYVEGDDWGHMTEPHAR